MNITAAPEANLAGPSSEAYAKTQFLERIAHELRGPAGVALGALHELSLVLGDAATEHEPLFSMARRGLQRIVRTAERLQQTGQLEAQQTHFVLEPQDLCDLVTQAVREAERLESRKTISVEMHLPPPPCAAAIDARWLPVAVFEVASNAIRHARKRVDVSLKHVPQGIELMIEDDGISSVPFSPRRFVATPDRRGLGVSLANAAEIVIHHRGSLSIEQGRVIGENFGARITIALPAPGLHPTAGYRTMEENRP